MSISAFQAITHVPKNSRPTRESAPINAPEYMATRADFKLQLDAVQKNGPEISKAESMVSDEIGALFIKNFLDAYIPKESSSNFDQGLASEYWNSMFTDSIAETIKNSNSLKIGL